MGCCFSVESGQSEGEKPVRKCTNTFWIVLFAAIWIFLFSVSLWSYANNHPKRFLHGTDSFGNICGMNNNKRRIEEVNWSGFDFRTRPYVFHLNPKDTSTTMKLCVSKCADQRLNHDGEVLEFYTRTNSSLFRYDYIPNNQDARNAFESLSKSPKAAEAAKNDQNRGFGFNPIYPVLPQRPVLSRCVSKEKIIYSKSSESINRAYSFLTSNDVFEKVIDDIYGTYPTIIMIVLAAIGLSLFVAMTIHLFASFVSSIIIIITLLTFIALSGFSWFVYIDLKYKLNKVPQVEQLPDDLINETTTLSFAILISIITIVVFIVVYGMSSRVKLMEALFVETASCLRSIPGLLCQPVWTSMVMLLFIAFWTVTLLGIVTAQKNVIFKAEDTRFKLQFGARLIDSWENGQPIFSREAYPQVGLPAVKHKRYDIVPYASSLHIIMLIWTAQFILGCQQMTVASSVATWYFSRDKENIDSPICASIFRVMSYHLGSVALGSLLIFVRLIFLIPLFIRYTLNRYKNQLSCLDCCLRCFEWFFQCLGKLLDYINDSTLTIVAIEGTPYCLSAKVAVRTLATNTVRVATLKTLGEFIILLGKILVTAASAILGIYLFRDDQSIHYMYAPVLFATVISFLVANAMLNVYSMAISIMFLCYSEDVEKNGNSSEGLFAPGSLLELARADIEDLRPGKLTIASEVNTRTPIARIPDDINKVQPVGFNLAELRESSH